MYYHRNILRAIAINKRKFATYCSILLFCVILLLYDCSSVRIDSKKPTTNVDNKLSPTFDDFRWCPKEVKAKINLDCNLLFSGHNESIVKAMSWNSPCNYTNSELATMSTNCGKFKSQFPFWSEIYKIPHQTFNYQMAFVVISSGNSVEQTIRSLQMVYNPQNVYCLTYDNKTSDEFKQTLHNLDMCYDNIVMPDRFVKIYWADYSILQTTMYCLKTLINLKIGWKYVQIFSWNDVPLRTNQEMIEILKIFNGAQDSLLDFVDEFERTRRYYRRTNGTILFKEDLIPEKIDELKNIPPGNLVEYKGSLATTMSREFVEFLFTNSIAIEFYKWLNNSFCGEEAYFVSLIHNLHINPPGGFPGPCLLNYMLKRRRPSYLSRYQLWEYDYLEDCYGMYTSFSCVFGVGDLEKLFNRVEFMAHKFYLDFDPAGYYCMAQLHFNKTFLPHEYSKLNLTFYENYPPVRYHRLKDKSKFNCY